MARRGDAPDDRYDDDYNDDWVRGDEPGDGVDTVVEQQRVERNRRADQHGVGVARQLDQARRGFVDERETKNEHVVGSIAEALAKPYFKLETRLLDELHY